MAVSEPAGSGSGEEGVAGESVQSSTPSSVPGPGPQPAAGGRHVGDDGRGAEGGAAGNGHKRRARPVFLLVGVALAVALGIGLFTGVGTSRTAGRPVAGDQVPSFTLPGVGGAAAVGVPTDGGGNGKPAILLFFASWCKPCQAEVPAIAATYHRQQQRHSRLATTVALIGVVGSDPTATALRFVRQSGVTFPAGADRDYSVTEGLFYFSGLPETVFVSATGTIADVHYGPISTATFVRWERRLVQGG